MDPEKEWILFLERNAQFYEISKGDFYIRFLERISESAKNFSQLKVLFPKVEEKDLQVIMDMLTKLKVVTITRIGRELFFTIAPDGKKLLSAYKKVHKFFST